MSDKTYISCVETARILRQVLKRAFPQTKFSIRSSQYSGGASINITWTDGPTVKQVKRITDKFEGAGFDAMTDYKTSKVLFYKGQETHFGANSIFEEHNYSKALLAEALKEVAQHSDGEINPEAIDLEALEAGRYNPILLQGHWAGQPLWTALWQVIEGRPWDSEDKGISKEATQAIPFDMLPKFIREY